MAPKTRYARSGDLHIAYQVVGDGPIDVVYIPTWISHVEMLWEEPMVERFFSAIAAFSRLIVFDRRGSGLSDPVTSRRRSRSRWTTCWRSWTRPAPRRRPCSRIWRAGRWRSSSPPPSRSARARWRSTPRSRARSKATTSRGPGRPRSARRRSTRCSRSGARASASRRSAPSLADERVREGLVRPPGAQRGEPGHGAALFQLTGEMDVRGVLPSIRVPTLIAAPHAGTR